MFSKFINTIKNEKSLITLITGLILLYFFTILAVLIGSIPFWYDGARDLLLALNNIKDPTLIGPPTGIPGIFYGPYWIWLLSLGLILSKDPGVVTLIVLTLPYLIFFPFILFKFNKVISFKVCILLTLLFFISFNQYVSQLWNPNLAPLLILLLIYIVVFSNSNNKRTIYLKTILSGFISGLIINFTISFGLGVFLGTFTFFAYEYIKDTVSIRKDGLLKEGIRNIPKILLFLIGSFIVFIPFFIFEYRHNFNQINTLYITIIAATLNNTSMVGVHGLTNWEIIQQFLGTLGNILKIPPIIYYLLSAFFAIYIFKGFKRKIFATSLEKRIILFSSFICFWVLFIYLTSKNPVWPYHFIGLEIIFILLIGLIVTKVSYLNKILIIWVFVLLFLNFSTSIKNIRTDPLTINSLMTQKYIVEQIYKDNNNKPFAVFSYSPSIYTFDYDYLFEWFSSKGYKKPESEIVKVKYVYLIIPKSSEEIKKDFINYKTPNNNYLTIKTWENLGETSIIKRQLRVKD